MTIFKDGVVTTKQDLIDQLEDMHHQHEHTGEFNYLELLNLLHEIALKLPEEK
jgi:hypothetical protein